MEKVGDKSMFDSRQRPLLIKCNLTVIFSSGKTEQNRTQDLVALVYLCKSSFGAHKLWGPITQFPGGLAIRLLT